jgi:hypothetical protein
VGIRKLRWINAAFIGKPGKEVDWTHYFSIERKGTKVYFSAWTSGELNCLISAIRQAAPPQKIDSYYYYEEVTLEVTLPNNLPAGASLALLIDPGEAKAIRWLNRDCGIPKITSQGPTTQFTWEYAGKRIYDVNNRFLFLDERFRVDHRSNWKITRHQKEHQMKTINENP